MSATVLVPVDGSPLSDRALRHALRRFSDAEVRVYHVIDLFEPDYGPDGEAASTYEPMLGTEEWHSFAAAERDRIFEAASELSAEYDRTVSTDADVGDPARLVVEYADEEDVDHVVIGAHGRPSPTRPFFGTVAERVARRASVPVTIVR